jgi:uncharacterized protein (TIGR02147 family)
MRNSVFEYTDYREFLKDAFAHKKTTDRQMTYERICETIGMKSKGHLALILQGKARLSIPHALKIAELLKLKKRETEYLQNLVLFNHASSQVDKKTFFEKLLAFKESSIRIVNADQYEFYDKWYHSVIRAILEFNCFTDDYAGLAKKVVPPITPEEAQNSIALMERLGLIARGKDGFYRPVDRVIDTGAIAKTVAIDNVAIQTLRLAQESLDRFPKAERILSGMTLGISAKGYEALVQELRDFRRRIYRLVESDKADRVYQVAIQVFPTSTKEAL